MEDFFKADGLSRIIFYFQEVENLPDAGNFDSFQGWQSGEGPAMLGLEGLNVSYT